MATACLFHIVGKRPFLDGNKGVDAVACLVFLELNGYEFTAPGKELVEIVFALAPGEVEKADIAKRTITRGSAPGVTMKSYSNIRLLP